MSLLLLSSIFHCCEFLIHLKSGSQTAGYNQGVQRRWTWKMLKEIKLMKTENPVIPFVSLFGKRVWLEEDHLACHKEWQRKDVEGEEWHWHWADSRYDWFCVCAIAVRLVLRKYHGNGREWHRCLSKIIFFINDIRREGEYKSSRWIITNNKSIENTLNIRKK